MEESGQEVYLFVIEEVLLPTHIAEELLECVLEKMTGKFSFITADCSNPNTHQ